MRELHISEAMFCFGEGSVDSQSEVVSTLEKYWMMYTEQPLALLACFLHPETREFALKLSPNTALTGIVNISEIAVFYFKRFFGSNTPRNKLRGDVMKWIYGSLCEFCLLLFNVVILIVKTM